MVVNTFLGLLLVILGFLVKKYPNLIAGYNTMTEREKASHANFDRRINN